MGVKELINKELILFDGAMGTMLQKNGLKLGENPEKLNFSHEDMIIKIHKSYIDSGANIITTNTFGANRLKLKESGYSVEETISKAVSLAKEATKDTNAFIALDIGPIGELLEPMGTLSFEEAYEIFKEQIIIGHKAGADLILIETMTDLYEAKAAILAAKENCNLPVFCTMSFEEDGRTFTGCLSSSMAITLEGLGVDALGVNCSLGPDKILKVIKEIKKYTNLPLMVQPNAGLPSIIFGEAIYDISIEDFTEGIEELINEGVSIIGGCCGTTPEFISSIRLLINNKEIISRPKVSFTAVCSPSKFIEINGVEVIGERINPTGKKLFKEALKNNDMNYILKQGIEQVEAGASILDVNVGLPEIDEVKCIRDSVKSLQGILDTPLQIDSTNVDAVEAGLRYYNGKAIVNSVNGDDEILDKLLPIVKKYGAAVVGLTLDKEGIPALAEERFKIAEKIFNRAISYGIKKEDIFIDTLVMPVSADGQSAKETLKALRLIREKLGLKTVLGVSNISFGLPSREIINKTFLSLALEEGLNLPIMNPNSEAMMEVIDSFKLLYNYDKKGSKFIEKYGNKIKKEVVAENKNNSGLSELIIKGLKKEAQTVTKELLKENEPIDVINKHIIPALNIVGERFEKGQIFLPQLISSAETVQSSFEILKNNIKISDNINSEKIILATVKGDIHDIGKNIVKVMLESYGFQVIDLGKNVDKEEVLNCAKEQNVKLIGLSALMTTTVKSMEETIQLLKINDLNAKIMVGGAVLTEEYAKEINADYYAKDAMESVKIAKEYFANCNCI
ncbi:homocysteine S-methyltransferase family protein [Clostridium celatum]|uniref:homocysteine S-methyltransferase family protein n=1 Tax=Clostridium celatum TaxID=36834 RepID=UPI001899760E